MTPAPIKAVATVADLDKLDIRVGTIREVLDVPGSDKLVQLIVSRTARARDRGAAGADQSPGRGCVNAAAGADRAST